MAMTSLALVGNSAGSSHPILRPLPAMSHEAEILEVYDLCLGYDAGNFPYQQTEREMRLIFSAWSLGSLCGNISI
jgi:hypothetical protein